MHSSGYVLQTWTDAQHRAKTTCSAGMPTITRVCGEIGFVAFFNDITPKLESMLEWPVCRLFGIYLTIE